MARTIDERRVRQLLAQGLSQREISRRLDIPKSTLHDYLKHARVPEVYPGPPKTPAPAGGPQVSPGVPSTELEAMKADLLEVVEWWRERKRRRVDPGPPRYTQRWTVHVDPRWIQQVKEAAEAEGTSRAEIVDRALRRYFESR